MANRDGNNPDEPGDQEPTDSRSPGFPERFPEPPDLTRVRKLRRQLRKDRSTRRPKRRAVNSDAARRARDIGTYTLIPMMMMAGPVVGYLLGNFAQKRWGGEPWPVVGGTLFGLVAAFRQIFLLLARKQKVAGKPDDPNRS